MRYGKGNPDNATRIWSRELDLTVGNVLQNRIHHSVDVRVDSLDISDFTVDVSYRVRKDMPRRMDENVTQETVIVQRANNPGVSQYETPGAEGKYFVEILGFSLEVPSLGFDSQYVGKMFAMERYNCPFYPGHGARKSLFMDESGG